MAFVVVLALACPAAAADGDYDISSSDWNGLSDLVTLARASGIESVEHMRDLDWEELGEDDVLFLLYPTEPIEPAHIAAFVRAGGRLLIADDYGRSDEALAQLGMLRRYGAVKARRYWQENMALPIATAYDDGHPLARGVDELVTNHPSHFVVDRGDLVFGFGKSEGVVVAGTLGDGRFVALSDPSLLINAMLAFDGNATFATNLVRFLAPEGDRGAPRGRIVVLSGGFQLLGEPQDHSTGALASGNAAAKWMNKQLDEWNDYIASTTTMRTLGMVGAFAVLIVGLLLLPLARDRQRLDGGWTRAAAGVERIDFERLLDHYDDANWEGSFAYPAAVLRDAAETRLGDLVGVASPLANLEAADLIRRIERRAGPAAAMALAEALPRLAVLPTREQTQGVWGTRHVSRREFDRSYDAVHALERALGNAPPPPQRT